jgi:hypothetical protein
LHQEGKNALEISKILGFKYSQPVYNYFKKQGWDRLDRSDYKYNTTYTVNQEFFDEINTEEKAYILGFICADGHIQPDRLHIGVASKDVDILYKIRKALNSNHPIKEVIKTNPYRNTNNRTLLLSELMIGSVVR